MKKRVAIIGSDLSQELFDKNKQKSEEDFEIVLYRKNLLTGTLRRISVWRKWQSIVKSVLHI